MPDISNSVPTDLPSTRTLVRSTVLALTIAGVLLATVVLPAEYGVDPTRVGGALGLTKMGKIKASLAEDVQQAQTGSPDGQTPPPPALSSGTPPPAAAEAPTGPLAGAVPASRSDTTTITLRPNQGREVKLSMREGARVTFSWSTDHGVVNYDQHADSKQPPRDYHGYRKGSRVGSDRGELVAAFDGWHGWFWRNRGADPVTVTLRTDGDYLDIKEVP